MKKLNVIKYYGSKAVLCDKIADMLDYRNTKVYVEAFGGGGSILLNKPGHEFEIYNEFDFGLYTLFSVLSNTEMGNELCHRLRYTEYSNERFDNAMDCRNKYQDNPLKENLRKMERLIRKLEKKHEIEAYRTYSKTTDDEEWVKDISKGIRLNQSEKEEGYRLFDEYNQILYSNIDGLEKLRDKLFSVANTYGTANGIEGVSSLETDVKYGGMTISVFLNKCLSFMEDNTEAFSGYIGEIIKVKEAIKCLTDKTAEEWALQENITDSEKVELAESVYIVYNMSRDGMGKAYAEYKNSARLFQNKTGRLFDVMGRLKNVEVTNNNIVELAASGKLKEGFGLGAYDDSEIMFYLDPPYLNQKGEGSKKSYLAGDIYKTGGFTEDTHKKLLQGIQNNGFKMIVSNYVDEDNIYGSYLDSTHGWEKREIETYTTVGGTARSRTEALWLNY